ncbi:hypothetical protein HYPSUDRAFT_50705 [Hypholoma sublateritium FD-334 SS-4]|uniref:Uncharacterized protein n=1 Tax=Hypholoma sublateritium (strain FD-334 SS-4) TaxID=945553 RepID=A0A0D2LMK4_HYPSF|nr:hypothetical protein HYPSUDRAFT_50705 [Hypholoma sublateritium FD-334 SS-4]
MAADYSLGLVTANRTVPGSLPSARLSAPTGLVSSSRPANQIRYSESGSLDDLLDSYNAASAKGDILSGLAEQSGDLDDGDFQQQYASALSDYSDNVSGFHTTLAKTLSDKGLANYDRTNSIETILKDFFNLNKGIFNSINVYLPTIPVIGPIVGPLFYNIKCLLDGILNEVEDSTDGAINALQPLLAAILDGMVSKTCKSGAELAGLCI